MDHSRLEASKYAKHGLKETHFLAFKYIPELINKYAHGKKTLDYGCGAGRSTRLNELGLEVEGVDIDSNMIKEALKIDASFNYKVIDSAKLPMKPKNYDVVFSSLVMLKITTKKELLEIFKVIYNALKDDGVYIFVTSSTKMYTHKWLSLDTDFKDNKNLKSGSVAKILLKDINLEVRDYFLDVIKHSGFQFQEKIYPLGNESDGYSWINETTISPYVVYVLTKS